MADYQKHTTHTDALDTLGHIINVDEQGRDAIHIAVEPAVAGEPLYQGDEVFLSQRDGKAYATDRANATGIVDPFLVTHVKAGEGFWLLVMPREITSLRHVWEHPDFPNSGETSKPVVSTAATAVADLRHATERFREMCHQIGYSVGEVIRGVQTGYPLGGEGNPYPVTWDFDEPEYLMSRNADAHGEIPDGFWDLYKQVTGEEPPARPRHFTCSC